jgi:hypothetical protein
VAALAAVGCGTTPAVGTFVQLRPETATECTANCERLGMRLGAVVLIRNSAGCVCEPRQASPEIRGAAPQEPGAPRATVTGGAGAAVGSVVIVASEEEAAEEQRRRAAQGTPGTGGVSASSGPSTHRPAAYR